MIQITSVSGHLPQTEWRNGEGIEMGFIKTITKLVGTADSIATQDIESLFVRFETMQDEKLQSPTGLLSKILEEQSVHSIHRLFVRIYYAPSERDQPTR